MESADWFFGTFTFRLIHQPCFWPDVPRPSSRTPLKTWSARVEARPCSDPYQGTKFPVTKLGFPVPNCREFSQKAHPSRGLRADAAPGSASKMLNSLYISLIAGNSALGERFATDCVIHHSVHRVLACLALR